MDVTPNPWQVVVVPFPFSERPGGKRRPALALSSTAFNEAGHTILARLDHAGIARLYDR